MPAKTKPSRTSSGKKPERSKQKSNFAPDPPLARNTRSLPVNSESEVSDETENGTDDGADDVTEEGMAKMMELLGDDGLNDFDLAQLGSFAGDQADTDGRVNSSANEDSDNGEDEAGDESFSSESASEPITREFEAEEGSWAGEDASEDQLSDTPDEAVALDDVAESVDEDAIPRQKLVVDNHVCDYYHYDLTRKLMCSALDRS
jgi:rRNA-processing protein EBP2